MKWFLRHIVKYGFISFALLQLLSYTSLYFLRISSFYKPQFVTNVVANQSYDYVILGSSTGLTTLNTALIDIETGLAGLNISMDDTSLGTHYVMLQHFLAEGGTTDKLVLSISYGDLANGAPTLSGNDYRFLPFSLRPYVSEYYATFKGEEAYRYRLSKYLPFIGVSYYNAELLYPSLFAAIRPNKRNRFDGRGNYVYPSRGSKLPQNPNVKNVSLTIENPFFEKIKALCLQKGIELIVYHPPIYDRSVKGVLKGVQFVNHSDLIVDQKAFYDRIHVNGLGRVVASQAISEYLK